MCYKSKSLSCLIQLFNTFQSMLGKIKYGSHLGIDTSHIPDELGFVLVYPFAKTMHTYPMNVKTEPSIITFRDEDTTMGELLANFVQKFDHLKMQKNLYFELSNQQILSNKKSIAQLSKNLKVSNVDSLILYIKKKEAYVSTTGEEENDSEDSQTFENECAILEEMGVEQSLTHPYTVNLNFVLPNSNGQVMTISCVPEATLEKVISELEEKVAQYFNVDLSKIEDLSFSYQYQKEVKPLKKSVMMIKNIQGLVNWSTIKMETSKKVKFQRKNQYPQNKVIIYRENSNEYICQRFEAIEFMTFRTLYLEKLAPEHLKKKDRQMLRCLKVSDILIREEENLSKLAPYFRMNQKFNVVNVVGRVVSEKMHFYKMMYEISPENFNIEDHIKPKQKEETEQFRERIRRKIEEKARDAEDKHFEDMHNVEPIYVYTCEEVHHIYEKEYSLEKSEPVYALINRITRLESKLKKDLQQLKQDWKCQFTSLLLKQLSKISPTARIVYRGADYDPCAKQGDILTFKPFTSTSAKKQVAENFFQSPEKKDATENTLFVMVVTGGKSIGKYSQYKREEQYLLEPFTQFKVENVKVEVIKKNNRNVNKRMVQLVQLSEEESSTRYPKTQANFIVWVDDKKFQGGGIYQNIKVFRHPTMLIQLGSTQELKEWLSQEKTKNILKDPTSHIVFITNMTREGNSLAGIQGVIQLQKAESHKEIPIFFYIYNKELAYKKIKDHQSQIRNWDNIGVGNNLAEIEVFLKSSIKIDFQVFETNQPSVYKATTNPEDKEEQQSFEENLNKTWHPSNKIEIIEQLKVQSGMTKKTSLQQKKEKKEKDCLIM